MEEHKNETLDEILENSTIENPEVTFCEQTTYLDFLLSNAKTEEEKEQIKATINNYLEISKEDTEEIPVIDPDEEGCEQEEFDLDEEDEDEDEEEDEEE